MAWHEHAGMKWLLRLAGVALLALAWIAARALRQHALAGPVTTDPAAYLLALIAFIGVSAGLALGAMGVHLFDQVEIAARWRRPEVRSISPEPPPRFRRARASPPSPEGPLPALPGHDRAHPPRDGAIASSVVLPVDPI